ncbi:MAG TPA: S24/S26 family peptidase [Gaiellaceae bacterium]|nr:S24/S26 family peptidase [Gaiellaceae bacterium]
MIRIAGGLVGALAVVAAWLWLAPANLGGGTSYVVLYGSSMEPRYHGGDLVLARPAEDYAVGDVVAYHHPQLGRTVLHRIVARDGDRFQFKGDGNDYLDLPRPSRVQVIGREWVHVPRAGAALEWIRQPAHAALAVLALVLLLAGGGGAEVTRRRSRQGAVPLAELVRTTARDEQGRRALRATSVVAALVLAALAVGAIAYARPLEESASWPGRWQQAARLTYGADVRPSTVYPSGRVTTGDAVYSRLAPRVRLRLDYSLRTPDGAATLVRGTGALVARVKGDNGWRTTIPVVARRPLAAPAAVLEGDLDLRRLVADVRRVEALTGARATSYAVSVAAAISMTGAVGDDAVDSRFSPSFAFRLVEDRLEAVPPDPAASVETPPSAWVRSEEGTGTRLVPRRLALGAAGATVEQLRGLAVLLALLALAAVPAAVLYVLFGGRGHDPAASLLAPWLVDVEELPPARELRDVPSPEALARLAERFETVVLRVARPAWRVYAVEAHGVLYRYRDGGVDEWPEPTVVRGEPVSAEPPLPATVSQLPRPRVVTPLRERVGP